VGQGVEPQRRLMGTTSEDAEQRLCSVGNRFFIRTRDALRASWYVAGAVASWSSVPVAS
jgi:hypothetical protein